MIGEYFISIHEPEKDDTWFILQTDKGYYELRMGGIALTPKPSFAPTIEVPFKTAQISRILTDNFEVYIELDNGFCISHSDTWIDSNGQTSFAINFYDAQTYIADRGFDDMKPISVIA
jgi:hypothetical protein